MIKTLIQNFFPIKKIERKKIILIALLKGLTSFIFSVLFALKEAAIVTAAGSGAEVIPVIKATLILPMSILLVLLYTKLSNYIKPLNLIYFFISIFIIGLFVYGFVLLPNEKFFTPVQSADTLLQILGKNNSHWVAVYKYWIHSLFFVLAELWGQVGIFILFWGFANMVCSVDQAKRSYNLFITTGSIGGILHAPLVLSLKNNIPVIILILIIGLICLIFLYKKATYYIVESKSETKDNFNKKYKMSVLESFKYIITSKYLIAIAIMVLSCSLSINLIHITWKANLKNVMQSKEAYLSFMSYYDILINSVSLFIVFFISGNVIRKYGWGKSSLVPPLVIGISGMIFFFISKYQSNLQIVISKLGIKVTLFVVILGTIQAVLSKSVKYSFFDITKEIIYIPLSPEIKNKGKVAIDTIGSRLGKSSSSFVHLFALWIANTNQVLSITSIFIPILCFVICGWIYSVKYLDKKFTQLIKK